MMWFIMDCGTERVTLLHTLGLLWLFSAVSDNDMFVTVAKGRGEQWAEPLVKLATKLPDVAKKYTLHFQEFNSDFCHIGFTNILLLYGNCGYTSENFKE